MGERDLGRLFGHRAANLRDAVPNTHDRRLSRGIEITPSARVDNPAALAANRYGIRFAEIAREE
jgi:hypothetical protein